MKLTDILSLVGRLDDSDGVDPPRERFRAFLRDNVGDIGQLRDYVEDCLRNTGEQYNRALQDLVNRIGMFLGFEVTYGRYQGVRGKIGFDGCWKSPRDAYIVIEVKTSEAYAVKTSALVGYIADLVSEKLIPTSDHALGLYVIGRPDPDLQQLQNAIIAEKRSGQLRTISISSLLSLAELANEYDVTHDDILALIRPAGPSVDTVVELMARLVAQPVPEVKPEPTQYVSEVKELHEPEPSYGAEATYWLTPVTSDQEASADEVISRLVGQERMYAFGERTPGRKHLKAGDWMCFYSSGKGVVAYAKIASEPKHGPNPAVRHSDRYPWTFGLSDARLYLDNPVVIDSELRAQLDAFAGRDADRAWAWFVQATRRITERDFGVLTRR